MAVPACRSVATATEFQTFTSFRERTIVQGQTQLVFDPNAVGITTVLSINRAGNTVSVRSRVTGVTVTTVDRVTTVSTSTILSSSPITTLYAPCTVTTTPAIATTTSSTTIATTPSTTASTTPATTAPPSTITVVSMIPISSSTSSSSTTSVARGDQVSNASSKPNTGAIAGGVVGGVVALVALAALLWFCCCGSKRNKKHESFDFGHNDAWDPVGGVVATGAGGVIAARNTGKSQGNATQRASSYSRRSTGFNYGDDDDMDDSVGIGRWGTAMAPAMASVGAVGAGLGATYTARQQSQKRKKATPADEQDAYYASLPPPPRDGSITPSSMSSAGGFGMAGVGISRYSQYGPQDPRAQHELYNGQETETMRPNDGGWAAANRMQQAPYNGNGVPQRNSMGGGPQGYGAVPATSPQRQLAGRGPQQNLPQRVPQAHQPQEQRFLSSIAYNAPGGPGASASPASSHQSLPGLAVGWNGVGDGERRPGALRVMNEEPEMTEEERRFGGQPDAYDGLTDGLDRVASPGRALTYRS